MNGFNLYYIFNNQHFSYPAAFSQSTNQRRNAGSFIAGFSASTHNLDFDYTRLPEVIQDNMNSSMKVEHIKYTNIALNFGYAYNWVFARNCLACLSLNPAIAYKTSRIKKIEGGKGRLVQEHQCRLYFKSRRDVQHRQIFRRDLLRRPDLRLLSKQLLPEQRLRYAASICRFQFLSEKGV